MLAVFFLQIFLVLCSYCRWCKEGECKPIQGARWSLDRRSSCRSACLAKSIGHQEVHNKWQCSMLMLRVDKKLPSVSLLHQVYWTSGGKHHVTMLILSVAKNLMLVLTSDQPHQVCQTSGFRRYCKQHVAMLILSVDKKLLSVSGSDCWLSNRKQAKFFFLPTKILQYVCGMRGS